VTIGKSERQPGELASFADKDFFGSIGCLDLGSCHYLASSRTPRDTTRQTPQTKLYSMLLAD
jgi:hypothetical protein